MRILFLSRWFPFPPDNGSKLRIYNLLRGLSRFHEITLVSFIDDKVTDLSPVELSSICREIHTVPLKFYHPYSLSALAGFITPVPRSVVDTYSKEMEKQIAHLITSLRYDLIIASQVDTASYAHCFRGLPALFEEVEVAVLYERYAKAATTWHRFRHGLTWLKQRIYLMRLTKYFSACTVVSEAERSLLTQTVHSNSVIEVIPNCLNLNDYTEIYSTPQINQLIFTGSLSYYPNYQGLIWFLDEVYPRILKMAPDIHLLVTGDNADLPLPSLRNVSLTGLVKDVRPLISSSWVSLAPILIGGGTRLKILEAMALCTPVVSTTKGAEGLHVESGTNILIADTAQDFADAVLRLLSNTHLRSSIAQNAAELLNEKYAWSVVMPHFLSLIERITLKA